MHTHTRERGRREVTDIDDERLFGCVVVRISTTTICEERRRRRRIIDNAMDRQWDLLRTPTDDDFKEDEEDQLVVKSRRRRRWRARCYRGWRQWLDADSASQVVVVAETTGVLEQIFAVENDETLNKTTTTKTKKTLKKRT